MVQSRIEYCSKQFNTEFPLIMTEPRLNVYSAQFIAPIYPTYLRDDKGALVTGANGEPTLITVKTDVRRIRLQPIGQLTGRQSFQRSRQCQHTYKHDYRFGRRQCRMVERLEVADDIWCRLSRRKFNQLHEHAAR